ncbi:hypothetical protein HNR30_007614 [Nonomuraea soli]|uniref:beta-glucosidase n=1 Tax=Nonomuraea soli TaxID=1032476 RepID=A0A7W0CS72_9ACTN|nr:hypothetical protein [Nonomuraea soli]
MYKDKNRPVAERVEDLLARMTLEEKAGLLFQTMVFFGGPVDQIDEHAMTHFNILGSGSPREMAEWHNTQQERAAATRLGIPVTFSTDPRNSFSSNPGAAIMAGAFSQWPEPTGLAAIGDEALVERFADIARQEYLAVGIRLALHPQIDLATEPRWARVNATFGQDADLTSRLVKAYIRGFQGERLGPGSVACMTKHFPGGGRRRTARTRTSPTAASRSTRAATSTTTSGPSRPPSRRAPARSCPTTACRSARSTRRSASASARASSPACCASATASTASSAPTGGCSPTPRSWARRCPRVPGAWST